MHTAVYIGLEINDMSAERITKLLKKKKKAEALRELIALIRADYQNPNHIKILEAVVESMTIKNETSTKAALLCGFVDQLIRSNRMADAVPMASYIYRFMNQHPEPNRLMAIICEKLEDREKAQTYCERLLTIQPDNANNHAFLGRIKRARKDMHGALASFNTALDLDRESETLLSELGIFLFEVGEYNQGADIYGRLYDLHPKNELAAANLMISLMATGRLEEAQEVIKTADESLNKNAFYLDAKAKICLEIGELEEALKCSERAVALMPKKDTFKATLSHVLLSSGRLREGFQHYKHRFSEEMIGGVILEDIDIPMLTKREQAQGKHVFIRTEQGLGDTLNFCQLLNLLRDDASKITFGVQTPLVSLMRSCFPDINIVEGKNHPTDADYYCPLIDLASVYRIGLEDLPLSCNYVRSQKTYVDKWKKVLGPKKSFRVGLTWSGGTATRHDKKRTIPLDKFLSCLPEGPEYISLQKEVRDYDVESLKAASQIRHFGGRLEDFEDTAAIVETVDLVVCVDTSIVHLCSAMGKQTLMLTPFKADFRWLVDRSDSPWYPSLELVRQKEPLEWDSVFEVVRSRISELQTSDSLKDAS